jgi:hypothetical protein
MHLRAFLPCPVLCCFCVLLLQRQLVRYISEPPQLQHVPSFGYVSLFPLLMQLIPPDSDILGHHLQLLQQEELLWTPHGLRSLATTSSIYNKWVLLGTQALAGQQWALFCVSCCAVLASAASGWPGQRAPAT